MRDFYFRAWHEANKEMVYFDNAKAKNDIYISGSMMSIFDNDFSTPMMQYIGLKDVNGKYIYEGDTMELLDIRKANIIFHGGSFCVDLGYTQVPITEFYYNDVLSKSKVVGNIYEGIKWLQRKYWR